MHQVFKDCDLTKTRMMCILFKWYYLGFETKYVDENISLNEMSNCYASLQKWVNHFKKSIKQTGRKRTRKKDSSTIQRRKRRRF